MKQYFLRRLFWFLPTLLGSLTLVFFLMHLVPGDPVDAMLGETASRADKEALRRELGLDRPLVKQYGRFLGGLAAGDLGRSLSQGEPVLDLILSRLPATLELSLVAMALGLFMAIPLGIMAAVNHRSWIDQTSLWVSLLGLSMPNFWLGPLLIILFSIELGWLPVSGRGGPQHLVLPALTLGLSLSAILTRMLRSSLLEVIHEEFIRTARAKGLSEPRVWLKHALRNALNSCITIVGLQCGSLLAGAIITETIFSWPGIGRLTLQAIQMRDYPLAQGCILVISVGYLVVNFLTDLLYRVADPRITYVR